MIPAVFHWATVPSPSSSDNQPYNFPTADGQTTYLTNQSISLNYNNGQNGPDGATGIAAGNFFTSDGDDNLDLAVTNTVSDNLSILKGDGNGSFTTWGAPVSLDAPMVRMASRSATSSTIRAPRIWPSPTTRATRSASCSAMATGPSRQ